MGVRPQEARHLIGRLGEFHCALQVGGTLAHTTNQHGFDVVCPRGRKISVKTTAQLTGFVPIGKTTASLADDLMLVQYLDGRLTTLFYGPMSAVVAVARHYKPTNNYEFDLSRARRLSTTLATEDKPMTVVTPREEFEADLQPFASSHGLSPVWHSPTLLNLEPVSGSSSAKLCISFDPGYWELYEQRDSFVREQARANVVTQTAIYRVDWPGQVAQELHGSLSALAPLS